ncbi:ATP-binding protein, partial [Ancylothrix sp. C2]|uniref:AAA family ATPase n=1 Tax=Ancylothrix sp. D3o TaxID=2953691 RepID=UPI0021BA5327
MDLYTLPQLLKSNCPIVEVVAPLIERPRVFNYISGVAGLFQIPTYLCSFGSLELLLFSDGAVVPVEKINGSFFDFLNHWDKPGLFIIENLQSLLGVSSDWQSKQQNLEMTSQLVNLFYKLVTRKDCYVVLLSTAGQHLNSTLAGLIPSLVEPLPSPCNLVEYLEDLTAEFPIVSAFDKDELIGAVSGLYQEEIKRGIYYWHCGLLGDIDLVASLLKYKIERFREFGLNFKQPSLMSEFGGLDRLRSALDSVVFRYSTVAQSLGLPLPKGWLMVGPPGTGKTFAAGVCAAKLKVPLVIVDVGAMVAGGVVYVEELLRRVEALGRSVLYFDEFDKLFSAS